jgi:hypothetical protein
VEDLGLDLLETGIPLGIEERLQPHRLIRQ